MKSLPQRWGKEEDSEGKKIVRWLWKGEEHRDMVEKLTSVGTGTVKREEILVVVRRKGGWKERKEWVLKGMIL